MQRVLIACLLLGTVVSGLAQTNVNRQLLIEQQNFIAWTARLLSPDFWISYDGNLSARATDAESRNVLKEYNAARSKYTMLTNRAARRQLVVSILSQEQGADKLIAPENATNLFARLDKPFLHLSKFKLIQSLPNGDAIIEDTEEDPNTYYVYRAGRAVDGKFYANENLVYEDLKTYQTALGTTKTVKAYTDVRLNEQEKALLLRVPNAFKSKSRELAATINRLSKAPKQ